MRLLELSARQQLRLPPRISPRLENISRREALSGHRLNLCGSEVRKLHENECFDDILNHISEFYVTAQSKRSFFVFI